MFPRTLCRLLPRGQDVFTRCYRAAIQTEVGKPLEIQDVDDVKQLRDRDILVQVCVRTVPFECVVVFQVDTAGVNNVDVQMIKGVHGATHQFPLTPGSEEISICQ